MPGNSERQSGIERYTREQIEKFKAGEVEGLPSNQELMSRFGLRSRTYINTVATRTGLIAERRALRQLEQEVPVIVPSADWGWMLGFIAGRCGISEGTGTITLQSGGEDPAFEAFRQAGERLFKVEPIKRSYARETHGKPYEARLMQFTRARIVQVIGNLTRGHWADAIEDKHPWLVEEGKYTWAFITGLFDAKGNVYTYEAKHPPAHSIMLSSPSFSDVNLLIALLNRVGIQNPSYMRRNNPQASREGIKGVILGNLQDIKTFATNVHSRIPEKEIRLQYYRDSDMQPQTGRRTVYSDQEVIQEWRRLTELLGHIPSVREIRSLRKQGQTLCAPIVYIERFGNGSFTQAKENLQNLASQQDTGLTDSVLDQPRRQQTNKPSSIDDIVREWQYLREELGHPSARDINLLRQQGRTRYSFGVYGRKFGEGSFQAAKEVLDRITGQPQAETHNTEL